MNLKTLGLIPKDLQISGSWSQCMRKNERGLSMNRPFVFVLVLDPGGHVS
jgi:hypothetical protein